MYFDIDAQQMQSKVLYIKSKLKAIKMKRVLI